MFLLSLFAFIAGLVTILSPCILPILPIILSSSVSQKGHKNFSRPLGVVIGYITSFTFFTLTLSTIVRATDISADSLRLTSIIIIGFFGITLLIPRFQIILEQLFARLSKFVPQTSTDPTFFAGLLVGLSLGLLWTPCVGPILASVITLAIAGQVTLSAVIITLSYAAGTALPMFLIIWGGQSLINKIPWLLKNTATIQKVFGIIMILTAIAIYFDIDRNFQRYVLENLPNYEQQLTAFEQIPYVQQLLDSSL